MKKIAIALFIALLTLGFNIYLSAEKNQGSNDPSKIQANIPDTKTDKLKAWQSPTLPNGDPNCKVVKCCNNGAGGKYCHEYKIHYCDPFICKGSGPIK